jgi:hypothetical protein
MIYPKQHPSIADKHGVFVGHFYVNESGTLVRIYKTNRYSVRVVGVNNNMDMWYKLDSFNDLYRKYNP